MSTLEGVVVLKGLILNNSYFGGCGGAKGTDFGYYLLWDVVMVLKGLIINNFHFERVC